MALSTIGGALISRTAQRVQSGPVVPDLVEDEEDFLAEDEDEDEDEDEEEEEEEELLAPTPVPFGGGRVVPGAPFYPTPGVGGGGEGRF